MLHYIKWSFTTLNLPPEKYSQLSYANAAKVLQQTLIFCTHQPKYSSMISKWFYKCTGRICPCIVVASHIGHIRFILDQKNPLKCCGKCSFVWMWLLCYLINKRDLLLKNYSTDNTNEITTMWLINRHWRRHNIRWRFCPRLLFLVQMNLTGMKDTLDDNLSLKRPAELSFDNNNYINRKYDQSCRLSLKRHFITKKLNKARHQRKSHTVKH